LPFAVRWLGCHIIEFASDWHRRPRCFGRCVRP